MTSGTQGTQAFAPWLAWLVPAAVAGMGVVGAISYIRSQETQAAGGSPLYGKAVREAIAGLKNPAAKAAVARPSLPVGLSPDEYYWCEQCKAYHKRQPVQGQPAAGTPPPGAGGGTPAQPAAAIPPLPAGFAPEDYYWCVNCKAYHKRQPAAAVPAGGTTPGTPTVPRQGPPAPGTAPAAPPAPEKTPPAAQPVAPPASGTSKQ